MEKNTESTRQLKVAKEIQKEMAEIIRSKVRLFSCSTSITASALSDGKMLT